MSSPALHRTITAELAAEIRSGAWRPGHRIPFEHELMARYGCARATVSKAVHALAEQGLVERRRRAGSFVARPPAQTAVLQIPDIGAEVSARGQAYAWSLLERRTRRSRQGDRLEGSSADTLVLEIRGLHLADAKPFAIEQRLISLAGAPEAASEDFAAQSPGAWLLDHVAWTEARHEIAARNPTVAEARTLRVPTDHACLSVERWTWRNGAIVTFARQLFPGEALTLSAKFTPGG